MKFSPVGGDLNIKRHLDVEQVLVLTQVTSHLPLGALQFVVQLVDGLLETQEGTYELLTLIYVFLIIICISKWFIRSRYLVLLPFSFFTSLCSVLLCNYAINNFFHYMETCFITAAGADCLSIRV